MQNFIRDCLRIRETKPLIHNITNYVAMTPSANALLAIGASPLMSFYPAEMEEIASISNGLLINLGCLDSQVLESARIAAARAYGKGTPWVLDPVGAGVSKCRTEAAARLATTFHPSIIKGNASEVRALWEAVCNNNLESSGSGIDSAEESSRVVECGKALSDATGSVVVISGEVDYICEGTTLATVANGSNIMTKITAMGCTAGAICAAFAAVDKDAFEAAHNAMALMGVCGEKAAGICKGTGSFAQAFMDILSSFDPEDINGQLRSLR